MGTIAGNCVVVIGGWASNKSSVLGSGLVVKAEEGDAGETG